MDAGATSWGARVGAFAVTGAVALLFMIDLCDLIYACGCLSLWNGAAAACNIHDPSSRHCPWCVAGAWAALPVLGVLGSQAAITLRAGEAGFLKRTAWGLLAFPVVGSLAGLLFGWAYGYWA